MSISPPTSSADDLGSIFADATAYAPTRSASTSGVRTRPATSPSASAGTSAWAPTSPALEIRSLFRELLGRVEHIELDGEPTWIRANFVQGPTSVPITYALR